MTASPIPADPPPHLSWSPAWRASPPSLGSPAPGRAAALFRAAGRERGGFSTCRPWRQSVTTRTCARSTASSSRRESRGRSLWWPSCASSSCWPTRYLERIAAGCPTGLGGAAQPGREARRWSPHDQLFNVNCFCRLAMIIFAGSDLAARWPCRTGIVTRSEACRASRRRPELGGVAAKAAASLAASFRSRTPVSGPQRHCPRSTTGGPGGRAAGESLPFPRQRFRQWIPTSLPPVYDRGPGRRAARRVAAVPASAFRQWTPASLPPVYDRGPGRASRKASRCRSRVSVPYRLAVAAPRRSCETLLGCRVRVVCDRARSRCQGRQPRAAGAERSDAP